MLRWPACPALPCFGAFTLLHQAAQAAAPPSWGRGWLCHPQGPKAASGLQAAGVQASLLRAHVTPGFLINTFLLPGCRRCSMCLWAEACSPDRVHQCTLAAVSSQQPPASKWAAHGSMQWPLACVHHATIACGACCPCAGSFARQPACQPACVRAFLPACWPARLPACLPACLAPSMWLRRAVWGCRPAGSFGRHSPE